jgi:magnesium-transporting ATPase (P-type)
MAPAAIHTLRVAEVYRQLDSSPEGLSSGEVDARLELFGPNSLPQPPSVPLWRKILNHIIHPMAIVLWGAGLLALIAGNGTLPWVIWCVVILNAAFSFWQEYRAEQAVSALSELLPNVARVQRGGQELMVPAHEIVPGDVLVLEQGNNVPADARIVQQYGLRTNQAALTGEAMASLKTEEASLREGLTDLERPNLVFMGSSIVSGTGLAVVFATGALTQFGRIARLTQAPEPVAARWSRRSSA